MAVWNVEESLENVQHILDERAASIGGGTRAGWNAVTRVELREKVNMERGGRLTRVI